MQRFLKVFRHSKCNTIGMIHVDALPGTPLYKGNWREIVEKAKHEAQLYKKYKLDAILIENMHDVPYVPQRLFGPETVASMASVANEVRRLMPAQTPCGIQILACGNRESLAIAKACDFQFIRAEGYVFGHVADEGYTDACAGELLRYRRHIDANDVLIFTDLKKKHCSHSITADVDLVDTAKAAEFFLTDGVVITGTATGHAASPKDLEALAAARINAPLLIGSGVTRDNVGQYYSQAHGAIIGSHFKEGGSWANPLSEERVAAFMERMRELRLEEDAVSVKA